MRLQCATKLLLSSALVLGISACSNSDSDSGGSGVASFLQGVFLDAPVKGLQFMAMPSGQSGVTNAAGQFTYAAGDTISFKLGNGTPISIGTVSAKPEVRVTEMPNFLAVAQSLQTFDTDPAADVIDVGQITIPAAIGSDLSTLFSTGQGDINTILSDSNIQAVEDASQPTAGSGEPAVDLINTSVVSEGDALSHISENISEDFTTADLSKQVFKRLRPNGSYDAFMYLNENGSGADYWDLAATGTESESFTWSINADKAGVFTYPNDSVVASLISVEGNKYIVSALESNSSTPNVTELLKAKPVSVAALDGKIFNRTSFDNNDSDNCTAQTFKFTGSSFDMKQNCNGQFFEVSGMLSASSDFDNTLVISGNSPSNNEPFSVMFSLMEGEIADGSTMKWATLDLNDPANPHFEEISYELTDQELQVPAGFTQADFSRQIYVQESSGMVLAFRSDNTGVEFNDGDNPGDSPYSSDFTWSIDSQNRVFIDSGGGDTVLATLQGVSGNAVTVDALTDDDGSQTLVLHKALPLSLSDLDGEILSPDMSNDTDCSAMTHKFTSSSINLSQICNSGFSVNAGTVSMQEDYDNVVEATFATSGSNNGGFTLLFALIDGDFSSTGKVASIIIDSNGGLDVGFNDITNVDSELTAPIGFSSSDIARQTYVYPEEDMIMVFDDDQTGKEIFGGSVPESVDFDWVIDSQNRLVLTYENNPAFTNTYTLNSFTGNSYDVTKVRGGDAPENRVLKKALPLTLADLDGKILSISSPDSNSSCTATTLKITGNNVRQSEVCSGVDQVMLLTIAEHPDRDTMMVLTEPDNSIVAFVLTSGNINTSGTLAAGKINADDVTVEWVNGSDNFTIVTQEAVPE